MANSFSASFPEIWAKEQQRQFFRKTVAMAICDKSFNSQLSRGDTLNRPYRSTDRVQVYTRGTAITIDDKTDTNEQLSINKEFANGFYIDNFDKIQSNYDLAANYGKDNGTLLSIQVDADVLGEYANVASGNVVDDGSIGGTSGNAIALTTSNVLAVFGAAKRALMKKNVDDSNLFAVVSPEVEDVLVQYGAGRDTNMGDQGAMNGFFGKFYGFDLYRSNVTTGTAVLAMATNPTDTDTITIAGVTITFVASIGSTAGNVLIGANVDATRGSLAGLINNPGTTSATQVALSVANQRLFSENFAATNDNSADTLTVVAKGQGVLVVAEALTAAADVWTTTKQAQHQLFGVKGNPVLVMQHEPSVEVRPVQDKLGVNILNGILYGVKTFVDNGKQLVDVSIKSDTFSAPAVS